MIEAFVRSLAATGTSPHTIRSYQGAVRAWFASGHDRGSNWLAALVEGGSSPSTVNQRRAALRSFYTWALREGLVDADPFADAQPTKEGKRLRVETITLPELARLIDACDCLGTPRRAARAAAMIALMATAGLRISEVCGLRPGDLDLEKRTAWVRGKGAKDRIIRIGAEADRRLRAWLELRTESEWLFSTLNGTPLGDGKVRIDLREACWWAGIDPIHPHVLRHTFATLAVDSKLPLEDLRQMLGHENLATTQRYLHRSPEQAWSQYDGLAVSDPLSLLHGSEVVGTEDPES